ncbi:hypothetical protein NDU88_005396 [Pleurodeles waltl]|uniref:Secreted protein n=1 Tax=Pleurodeles waltl TaxID=8319 RepID=A0AAV7MJ99_PLEWA|nr:hypothetical protein NDU88_005396 [Pleurodeles waltl]
MARDAQLLLFFLVGSRSQGTPCWCWINKPHAKEQYVKEEPRGQPSSGLGINKRTPWGTKCFTTPAPGSGSRTPVAVGGVLLRRRPFLRRAQLERTPRFHLSSFSPPPTVIRPLPPSCSRHLLRAPTLLRPLVPSTGASQPRPLREPQGPRACRGIRRPPCVPPGRHLVCSCNTRTGPVLCWCLEPLEPGN